MTGAAFIRDLGEMLQTEAHLGPETSLGSLPEWDSVAGMILVTYFDRNFGQLHTYDEIMACKTVAELMALGGVG